MRQIQQWSLVLATMLIWNTEPVCSQDGSQRGWFFSVGYGKLGREVDTLERQQLKMPGLGIGHYWASGRTQFEFDFIWKFEKKVFERTAALQGGGTTDLYWQDSSLLFLPRFRRGILPFLYINVGWGIFMQESRRISTVAILNKSSSSRLGQPGRGELMYDCIGISC